MLRVDTQTWGIATRESVQPVEQVPAGSKAARDGTKPVTSSAVTLTLSDEGKKAASTTDPMLKQQDPLEARKRRAAEAKEEAVKQEKPEQPAKPLRAIYVMLPYHRSTKQNADLSLGAKAQAGDTTSEELEQRSQSR